MEEGASMLSGLKRLGFEHVVATPHIRPGMFDNHALDLVTAYRSTLLDLRAYSDLPETSLASEHFFDSDVILRIHRGEGLPYRRESDLSEKREGGSILVEFHDLAPLKVIEAQLYELQVKGYRPVIAHPERYRACWKEPGIVERLVQLGSVALLDTAALVGKYGRRAKGSARELLDRGAYAAACSDAHRPSDIDLLEEGMSFISEEYGEEEVSRLFSTGPKALLGGTSSR